jgi:glycerophosphoryl diester phosphodiesterase
MAGPIVIAHRGASGYRPEHTLASYELGARLGADYIEPDLVATRDGVLVARHENEISGTTDVADRPEFADRRATKTIDGTELTGWFTEDFTLAELKTLRARERIPDVRPANTEYDGRFEIPTLDEVIQLAERLGVGVYPETKHPAYFRGIGLPLEEALLDALDGLQHVFIQSFEADSLRRMPGFPRVQLLTEPADLEEIAAYADAVGPRKSLIVPRDDDGRSLPPTTFVDDAHRAGLLVHPYTFRSEAAFLPLELRTADEGPRAEYERFLALGVDGVFSDHPDAAVAAMRDRR